MIWLDWLANKHVQSPPSPPSSDFLSAGVTDMLLDLKWVLRSEFRSSHLKGILLTQFLFLASFIKKKILVVLEN